MSRAYKDPNAGMGVDASPATVAATTYYAVGISLGASSTIVAVSSKQSQRVEVVANASGSRSTPTFVAFCESHDAPAVVEPVTPTTDGMPKPHYSLLYGNDAKQVFPRKADHVVPSVFSFAAAAAAAKAASRAACQGDSDCCESGGPILENLERVIKKQFSACCSIRKWTRKTEAGPQVCYGFVDPLLLPEDEDDAEIDEERIFSSAFVDVNDLFVDFLNHVKESTVDAACNLSSTAAPGVSSPTSEAPSEAVSTRTLFVTLSLPRYLFQLIDDRVAGTTPQLLEPFFREQEALEWIYACFAKSAFSSCTVSVEVLFSDVCAILGADAFKQATALQAGPSGKIPAAISSCFLAPPPALLWGPSGTGSSPLSNPLEASVFPPPHFFSGVVMVIDWGVHGLSVSLCPVENGLVILSRKSDAGDASAASGPHRLHFLRAPPTSFAKDSVSAAGTRTEYGALAGSGAAIDMLLSANITDAFIKKNSRMLGIRQVTDISLRSRRKLQLLSEEKKITLSSAAQTGVELEAFHEGVDLNDPQLLTKMRFENWVRQELSLMDGVTAVIASLLDDFSQYLDAAKGASGAVVDDSMKIGGVILAGGMCRVPVVAAHLKSLFLNIPTGSPAQGSPTTPAASSGASVTSKYRHCFQQSAATADEGAAETNTFTVPVIDNGSAAAADEVFAVGACLESVVSLLHFQNEKSAKRLGPKQRAPEKAPSSPTQTAATSSGKKGKAGGKKKQKGGGGGGSSKGKGGGGKAASGEADTAADVANEPGSLAPGALEDLLQGILPSHVVSYVTERSSTKSGIADESPVKDCIPEPVEDVIHLRQLHASVNLFIGTTAEMAAIVDEATRSPDQTVRVPSDKLVQVLPAHAILPAEVVVEIDGPSGNSAQKALLYFFAPVPVADGVQEDGRGTGSLMVPLTDRPVCVPLGASESAGRLVRLTVSAEKPCSTAVTDGGDQPPLGAGVQVGLEVACINERGKVVAQPEKVFLSTV